jgi:hypothetical protein
MFLDNMQVVMAEAILYLSEIGDQMHFSGFHRL